MDVFINLYDWERQLLSEINKKCNLCYVIFYFLAELLGNQYTFEILQTSLIVKISDNVIKQWVF